MATNKQEQAKAIYEIWDVILQHRWRFILPAFAITALVLLASLFLPRKYEAVAYFERENSPELVDAFRSGASSSYIDQMPAITKEIVSSDAVARVVEALEPRLRKVGYIDSAAQLTQLRSTVNQRLLVHHEYADKDKIKLRIELILDDPNIAALIVNGIVDHYMQSSRSAMLDRANSSISYYDEQIAEHRKNLDAIQKELGEFEQEHALLLPDQPYSLQVQLGEAREELARLDTELERLDIRRRSLREDIDQEPATNASVVHGPNPERTRLTLKLDALREQIREATHKLRMTEKHPEIIVLRQQESELVAQIEATEEQVVTATRNSPNPKRAELELRLSAANAERDAVKEQIAVRKTKINELAAMSVEMLPARAKHQKLTEAVETAQLDVEYVQGLRRRAANYLTPESGDRGVQMAFTRRAEALRTPVSPNVVQVVMVAVFLGIATGALSVFLAHRTDESFRNARQLTEATTIPLIGSVSELITRQHQRMRRLRHTVIYPLNAVVMTAVLVMFAGLLYLDLERPDIMHEIKDRAKSLVQTTLEMGPDESPPVEVATIESPR